MGEHDMKVSLRQSLSSYSDILRIQLRFGSDPDHLGFHHPIKSDRSNMDLMCSYPMFNDKELLKRKVQDFLKGRRTYLEEFEAKWGAIPDNIRSSLPYRYEQIDFTYLEKESLGHIE